MSLEITRWPLPDDIDRYQRELKMPRDAIVRDIARLVTVAQMVHDNELDDDLVLAGGMAMRLRGSPRFTISDTRLEARQEARHRPPGRLRGLLRRHRRHAGRGRVHLHGLVARTD